MSRSRSVAFCGLAIALIAVGAWVTVPLGPVPFTLQTMMMGFVILLLPRKEALTSIFAYVLIGAAGLPVFSGMRGGFGVILGSSGGFIYGFVIGALLAVLILRVWPEPASKPASYAREAVAVAAFLFASYFFGWLQLMAVADLGPLAAFAAGIAPFILIDAAKLAVGVVLAHSVRRAVPALRSDRAGA